MKELYFDDLAAPRLSFLQKAAIKAAEKQDVLFEEAHLLDMATARTGLSDFGDDRFLRGFRVLLDAYKNDEGMSGIGRAQMQADLLRCLSNRLLIEQRRKIAPDLDTITLAPPLSVSGLPRSGTTHLVNLLAADTRFQSLPLWRIQEPFHTPGQEKASLRVKLGAFFMRHFLRSDDTAHDDPRYLRCSLRWSGMQITGPALAAMHPMNPDHIHEELELMTYDFGCNQFEWTSVVPSYRDYYLATDQTPHYAYLRDVLKLMQLEEESHRPYVLKCVQNPEQLPALKSIFPQATAIMTHRDPVAVIQSTSTMIAYGHRILRKSPDPRAVFDYWTDRFEKLLRAFVRDRPLFDENQSIDIIFHEFMNDQMGTLERIYEKHDLEITPTARAQFKTYIKAHPRAKHGRVRYDMKDQFGVDPAELRERFEFYFDAFPIRSEF